MLRRRGRIRTKAVNHCSPPALDCANDRKCRSARNVLNRGWPVTDKSESAWQNRAISCKAGVGKSVYRELLPHDAGCMGWGACNVSSACESLCAGAQNLNEIWSDSGEPTLSTEHAANKPGQHFAKTQKLTTQRLFRAGTAFTRGARQCVTVRKTVRDSTAY